MTAREGHAVTDIDDRMLVDDGQMPAERPRGRVGRPRRDAGEPRLISEEFARRLVAQAREEGLDVAGDSGLLQQMMKSVLEAALAEELTDHLGYEHGDPAGRGSGNARNGSTPKTLAGPVALETPRDRAGTFAPQIVRKGQRRLDGLDKIVLGLYAKGMSTRDITAHLAEIYDVEVSPDLSGRRDRGGRRAETRTFSTMTRSLQMMRDWLLERGVTIAAMDSTFTYWKGAFYCLEEVMEVRLVNAAHIKAISRRKTDIATPNGSPSCWSAGCCARRSCHRRRSAG
jgi:hypothetical protein